MVELIKQVYRLRINTTVGALVNMTFVAWLVTERPWVWLVGVFMTGGLRPCLHRGWGYNSSEYHAGG